VGKEANEIKGIKVVAIMGDGAERYAKITPLHANIIRGLLAMAPTPGAQLSQETVEQMRMKDATKIVTATNNGIIKKL